MPRTEVMRNPPGSGPGMRNFASAPTTAPMRMIQTISNIGPPSALSPPRGELCWSPRVTVPRSSAGLACSRFRGYAQHLTDVDLVGVLEHRLVGLKDRHVLRRAAVVLLGDGRKVVALLDRVENRLRRGGS